MAVSPEMDTNLTELLTIQASLRSATVAWAHGVEPGPEIEGVRRKALCLLHERYLRLIPSYREVAGNLGSTRPVALEYIVENLLLRDVFKSYDPAFLAASDYAAMTTWLGTVFCRVPQPDLAGVSSIGVWRERLRADGVFLSFSSGTSGRMAFVPRDHNTFRALCTNGAAYADETWRLRPDGLLDFDCLIAGPRSGGMGLLDAAGGLARSASRSHFLFSQVLTADDVAGSGGGKGMQRFEAAALREAIEFVRRSAADSRKLLVFGAPFQIRWFCEQVASSGGVPAATPGSTLVTGGGWKSFQGDALSRKELTRLVLATLGIESAHCIDVYSTSELNCHFRTCRHGHYHIPPLIEPVVLDEALSGAPGESGSGMLAFLDPFALSYAGFVITGDVGTLRHGRCECGLPGPVLEGEVLRAPGMEIRGCGGVLESIRV